MGESVSRGGPGDVRAERAVLGACLIDPDAINHVADVARIAVSDFAPRKNGAPSRAQRVYAAMLALHDRGVVVDYLTVCGELQRQGALNAVGHWYLTSLINWCPTSLHVAAYAQRMTEARQPVVKGAVRV